ncbi:MAG TPA: PhzF family phenazine biosynthesis protein [Acidimicrobiales bacterium]|nr:PhzF family phenazine biosynthesis protein [Acidimicrobiales bacterium]
MILRLSVVDSFTHVPFAGNPAAVTVLQAFFDDARLGQIAREMNLSETAFLVPRGDGDHDLRWFTPSIEVDLCGHATLASAHVLGGHARFHTRSGPLTCTKHGDWIEMDLPSDVPAPGEVPKNLGLPGVRSFHRGRADALLELADAANVRALVPDLAALGGLGTRCVIVTAPGDRPGIDCVSRVFAPNAGIPEDPVTGSAHCTLAAFWGARLGRDDLVGEQASARGGIVRMRRAGDRVVISGQAVTVSEVDMTIPD